MKRQAIKEIQALLLEWFDRNHRQLPWRETKDPYKIWVSEVMLQQTQVKHAYTHFKIVVDVFLCQYMGGQIRLNGPADYRWITWTEIGNYPLPKANHKFLPKLRAIMDTLE